MNTRGTQVLHVHGPLRLPVSRDLRHRVRMLLLCGERGIVLNVSHVPSIDAAGIGELVRAYNMTTAQHGELRLEGAAGRVREMLVRARLFDLLTASQQPGCPVEQKAS
jgi:anti-anti-sigma factor